MPGPQRDALDSAFGLAAGPPPDRFLVGLGVLTLLAEVATEQPLIWLVDDAQWLDRESLEVLGFVGRRLYADRIGLLFGAREPSPGLTALDGLPTRRLSGLDPAAARALLAETVSGALNARVAARVISETGGNPLAMLELAGKLTADQLAGRAPLPQRLPVGRRLRGALPAPGERCPGHPHPSAARRGGDRQMTRRAVAGRALLGRGRGRRSRGSAGHRLGSPADGVPAPADPFRGVRGGPVRRPAPRSTMRWRYRRPDGDADQAAWHRAAAAVVPTRTSRPTWSAPPCGRNGGRLRRAGHVLDPGGGADAGSPERAVRLLAAAQAHLVAGDGALAEALLDRAAPRLTAPDCTWRRNACGRRSPCSSPGTRTRPPFCWTRRRGRPADVP